jgi:hypothetical protein
MTLPPDEQARELAGEWLVQHKLPIFDEVVDSLSALLARVRLAEAEWWQEWYNQEDNSSQYEHDRAVERIASLRQAAGEGTK